MRWMLAVVALLVAGCQRSPPAPPFKPVADVKQLMQAAIDPNADTIWEASGEIITATETVQRRPANDEAWTEVRNAAIVLAEAGNLLMMVPRARDGDVWMKRAQELIDAGTAAWKAADAKDVKRLFDAGADVYTACSHCHQDYMDAIKNANK